MKILITGGSGFLGSHLVDQLILNGHQCIIYDLKDPIGMHSKNLKYVKGDIQDQDKLSKIFSNIDVVYHFAGEADIKNANLNPLDAIKNNILSTTLLLKLSVKNKIKRFIFASTVYVYSEQGGIYKTTKQACELIIENFQKIYKLNYTILRFGSLYGSRANNFNWINEVIEKLKQNKKIIRETSGNEIRSYIHVEDAAKLSVKSMLPNYKNKYLMLTGSKSISVKNLLMLLKEISGSTSKISFSNKDNLNDHYKLSPFSFKPRMATKITLDDEIDLDQGLYDLIF